MLPSAGDEHRRRLLPVTEDPRERERQRLLAEILESQARFISRPLVVRIGLAVALVAVILLPFGLLVWLVVERTDVSPFWATIWYCCSAVLLVAGAVVRAVIPERCAEWSVRAMTTVPTRMPGYRTPLSGERYEDEPRRRDSS